MIPLVRATIDAGALRHNLGRVREIAPRSRVMAVIKADAYGHGLVATARALSGADGFAVARIEEGIALRAAGFGHRILLLEGVQDSQQLAAASKHRFDLMVHCFEQVEMLESRSSPRALDLWIKLDTGMNRLGFDPEEFPSAMERLAKAPGVAAEPTLVTHLACADDRGNPKTREQLELFDTATRGRPGRRSIANSAGILSWPQSHADWVRPGLMLYGLSPLADGCGGDLGLQPVMGLQSTVIATRRVHPGQTVGYGGTWRAARETRVAVVACGYADGYPRELQAPPMVRIGGQDAPVIGQVSMDMLCADVTELPPIAIGDPVVLWGGTLAVEELARRSGTIPYTIVCGVTQRVPRELR